MELPALLQVVRVHGQVAAVPQVGGEVQVAHQVLLTRCVQGVIPAPPLSLQSLSEGQLRNRR
jgi:hypothetical protein